MLNRFIILWLSFIIFACASTTNRITVTLFKLWSTFSAASTTWVYISRRSFETERPIRIGFLTNRINCNGMYSNCDPRLTCVSSVFQCFIGYFVFFVMFSPQILNSSISRIPFFHLFVKKTNRLIFLSIPIGWSWFGRNGRIIQWNYSNKSCKSSGETSKNTVSLTFLFISVDLFFNKIHFFPILKQASESFNETRFSDRKHIGLYNSNILRIRCAATICSWWRRRREYSVSWYCHRFIVQINSWPETMRHRWRSRFSCYIFVLLV